MQIVKSNINTFCGLGIVTELWYVGKKQLSRTVWLQAEHHIWMNYHSKVNIYNNIKFQIKNKL